MFFFNFKLKKTVLYIFQIAIRVWKAEINWYSSTVFKHFKYIHVINFKQYLKLVSRYNKRDKYSTKVVKLSGSSTIHIDSKVKCINDMLWIEWLLSIQYTHPTQKIIKKWNIKKIFDVLFCVRNVIVIWGLWIEILIKKKFCPIYRKQS